jgi:ferredoxin
VYARWPYLYIGIGLGEHWLARPLGFLARVWGPVSRRLSAKRGEGSTADGYHGKVMPLEAAQRLVAVGEEIRVADLEQVIPYPRARAIILQNPDHIVALECPCRTARREPCRPLDVCLIVGEPFAGLVVDHHPRRARWVTASEAEEILEAEHARGHVHHAFFKDAMLDRFYAICNCCPCCCGAMQAHRNGTPMLASSGFVCRLDPGLCVGCGLCEGICPFEALSFEDDRPAVDEARCMGCGVCTSKCETGALTLALDPKHGSPLDIFELRAASAAAQPRPSD